MRYAPMLMLLVAVACASPPSRNFEDAEAIQRSQAEALQKVRVTMDAGGAAGCRDLGIVEGQSRMVQVQEGGISAYSKPFFFDAKGELASRALALGGNVVLVGAGSTPNRMIGEAYSCP